MSPLLRRLLIVAVLLVPSLYYAWPNQDVPKFCDLHDDCIYFVSAKSLAGGNYLIESLPGEPVQTKYPPLYPALLSLAWKITPEFPANLTPAMWLSWLAIPFALWLLASYYPLIGLNGWRTWALLAGIAINPYTVLFSTTLLSEPLYVALLIGALVLVERARSQDKLTWAIVAGVVMGLAYLARSAGIVALVTVPLYFLLRRQRNLALGFFAAMFPFVGAWMLWAKLHQMHTTDPALMYYVDYAGYQIYNVSLKELPVLVWKNLDGLVWSFGSLIIPRVSNGMFVKILTEVVGVASIIGMIRLFRRGQAHCYGLFAAASCALLVIWHFPPNERFVFPMFPLILAGLLTEMEHLAHMLKAGQNHPDRSQRIAGRVLMAGAGTLGLAILALQFFMHLVFLPADAHQARVERDAQQAAFAWIRENTPPDAAIVATRDPLIYLATGRHAMTRPVLPIFWYHEDEQAVIDTFGTIAPFAREHAIPYLYYAGVDFGWAVEGDQSEKIDAAIRANNELQQIFTGGAGIVYRVAERAGLASAPNHAP